MLYDVRWNTSKKGCVDKVLSSSAFQDYEGRSLEDLRKDGVETQFTAQYFRAKGVKCSNYIKGDYGKVTPVIPHEGDRLVHVHYHPSFNVKPSRLDIYGEGRDAALLEGDIAVPPVYLIGADGKDHVLYSARQRKDFPGFFEKFLLGHKKARKFAELNPWEAYNRYEHEWQKNLHEQIVKSIGKKREKELIGKPFEEAVSAVGEIEELSKIYTVSLEKSLGYKTGIVKTSGGRHEWLYGSAENFA
jgi:hypothetical protein